MLELLQKTEEVSREYGLQINVNKTKLMIVDRVNEDQRQPAQPVKISNFEVENFVYMGSMLHRRGSCEFEIRQRIGITRFAMI